ncbi:hypothetical protein [Tianweitania aestuarii]|uniref:hypothetical protein n=1 Tax=Tianweitania aestuarii TaxID=2814886 RepID=UPI002022DF48|nr:hypothetical protein [Tianweitania aestuarii]
MRDMTVLRRSVMAVAALGLLSASPVWAQTPNDVSRPGDKTNCTEAAGKAEPATAPERNSDDGTAPGNTGSTGWSGGTGGAYIGTNPQGATAASPTWQPPTARGIDLAGVPEKVTPAAQGQSVPAAAGC